MDQDEGLRAACFARLELLRASHGDDIPYREALAEGFPFRGARVPFLSPQKGIFRAGAQKGPAALSIQTSFNSPYKDAELEKGFRYDYRSGSIDQPDNRALRGAFALRVEVHVARRLLEDEDGPMLELLKGFHREPIVLPARAVWRPDREQLAQRFARFTAA